MRVLEMEQGTEEWHKARMGKITGTKLKEVASTSTPLKADVVAALEDKEVEFVKGNTIPVLMAMLPKKKQQELKASVPKKLGFYEILAEKVAYEKGDARPMDRGTELEPEAREAVSKKLGETIVEEGICMHDKYDDISLSPDGIIYKTVGKKKKVPLYAVEIKCLSTARHLQAIEENKIPDDYKFQVLQYFIVIEELEVLYFAFYDPRIVGYELVIHEVHREEVQEEADKWFNYQVETLQEIEVLAEKYSNF